MGANVGATVLASGAEHYVDRGPGKRVWAFTVLALDDLTRYDGKPTGLSGQEYRDRLVASYDTIGVLPFVDPHGVAWQVRFDHLTESLPDFKSDGETVPGLYPDGQSSVRDTAERHKRGGDGIIPSPPLYFVATVWSCASYDARRLRRRR